MLCTSTVLSSINYNAYTVIGLPIPKPNGEEGYEFWQMVDIDHIDYPVTSPYPNSFGSDAQWDVWRDGKTKWVWADASGNSELGGDGYHIRTTGGYGQSMATLVTELPDHFCSGLKASKSESADL